MRYPTEPDDRRVLSLRGHAEAQEVAQRLGHLPLLRVLCGPALRCRQTVVPLARRLGLDVEPVRVLAPDADPVALGRFLSGPETGDAVLCTHRETLLAMFSYLAASGPRLVDGIAPMGTAAGWLVYGEPHRPRRIRYLPAGGAEAVPMRR